MKIVEVQVAYCPLAVPAPFRIGTTEIRTRDYVLVKVIAQDGTEGFGIGYAGGTQTFETLAVLARELVGKDPIARRALLAGMENRRVPARAGMQRALSLIDLALWDIACKSVALPLYRYLGEFRQSAPSLAVAGFRRDTRAEAEVMAEIAGLRAQGIGQVKLPLDAAQVSASVKFAAEVVACAGNTGEVVVDLHWAFRTLTPALQICTRLDDLGLGFIEDPFLPEQWRLAGELAKRLRTPIASGEDIGDLFTHREMCEVVGVARVDATTCGGITGAMAFMDVAAAYGRAVVPHVFPYIHVQLACAHPVVSAVEFIPESAMVDPIRTLLREFPALVGGRMVPSSLPGIGVHPDWDAVRKSASQFVSVADD